MNIVPFNQQSFLERSRTRRAGTASVLCLMEPYSTVKLDALINLTGAHAYAQFGLQDNPVKNAAKHFVNSDWAAAYVARAFACGFFAHPASRYWGTRYFNVQSRRNEGAAVSSGEQTTDWMNLYCWVSRLAFFPRLAVLTPSRSKSRPTTTTPRTTPTPTVVLPWATSPTTAWDRASCGRGATRATPTRGSPTRSSTPSERAPPSAARRARARRTDNRSSPFRAGRRAVTWRVAPARRAHTHLFPLPPPPCHCILFREIQSAS